MLPDGRLLGKMQGPLENLMSITPGFTGRLWITDPEGAGFLVVETGHPIAARFEDDDGISIQQGDEAIERIRSLPTIECEMAVYTPDELDEAWDYCCDAGCAVARETVEEPEPEPEPVDIEMMMSAERLEQIGKQPGVVAVSVFHEGFALQSFGNADVEQIAAVAEDLLRAGIRIVSDMAMGDLTQIILESPEGKLITAPYGELFICVLTEPDAHLGLIRLAIRRIQEDLVRP
ncbi:roadblock/LC7 domain-containing protein [Methanoculleus sp. FWC-SCC1]|uniref:Roadblock/LC7 domain-containing protein n=1 Tax=Methanoculleus frigidifontis TaxID=2584085 RepID=A0ABT8M6C5_9EURY|nr:roadblock/LC7 domain-containing protein [Methanoculleus sp. FWC-SCC1]MDN7023484.1 roadblock/LC7 domain-containing protein [Methanoculleus sp. FWC-SCC1]